jgi:hypothetical protein
MGERVLGSLAVLLAVSSFACAQGAPAEKLPPPAGASLTPADETAKPPAAKPPAGSPGKPDASCPPASEMGAFDLPPIEEGAATPANKGLPDQPPPWAQMYTNWGPGFWIDADWLHFWFKNAPIAAPLLTTGPVPLSATSGFGVLNQPGTQTVIGDQNIDQGQTDGARITVGGWWDPYCAPGKPQVGWEASYFVLPRVSTTLQQAGDNLGNPVLARPVIDAGTNQETSLIVSAPGVFATTGSGFTVSTSTEMWGAEANAFLPIYGSCHCLFGALLGFRYINLEESLEISQSSTPLMNGISFFSGLPVRTGESLTVFDDFETRNNFYGGQVGASLAFHYNRLALTAVGKLALGTMHQVVEINGNTTLNGPGFSQSVPGGLLALSSNSGGFGHYEFAVVPEGSLTLSYQIHEHISLTAGYTFLYANNVVRPGQQIDRTVNASLLPTSETFGQPTLAGARPAFQFQRSDFWAQGITAGISLSF